MHTDEAVFFDTDADLRTHYRNTDHEGADDREGDEVRDRRDRATVALGLRAAAAASPARRRRATAPGGKEVLAPPRPRAARNRKRWSRENARRRT